MRQVGTTTALMQNAAQNAIFVWCNDYLNYAIALARHLRRDDLRIISYSRCLRGDVFRGNDLPVVFDHTTLDRAATAGQMEKDNFDFQYWLLVRAGRV